MPNRKPSTRRTKKRQPLDRTRIAAAALQLIDKHGLDTLSMRQLGKALHVEAMALYHHFANKGELLDAVLDLLLSEVDLPAPGTRPPLEWLRHFAHRYRQMALQHPHAFILVPTRRFNSEQSIAIYEQILQVFAELGFDGALSARYFRTLAYFVSGAGLADIASHARQPDATPLRLENFHDPAYPLVSAAVPHLRAANLDGIFEFGLNIILDSVQRDAQTLKKNHNAKRKKS